VYVALWHDLLLQLAHGSMQVQPDEPDPLITIPLCCAAVGAVHANKNADSNGSSTADDDDSSSTIVRVADAARS